ncbi:MAG: hypothetical protein KCHDKBKB_01952 [Elusimicrobia bacterium]|nr:hypothetical protein [Elusimicrobiota bacterium]
MNPSVLTDHGIFALVFLGLAFSFSNGFRDSSSIVATIVSTRTLTPNTAFVLSAFFEFGGALFLGSAVASTIGSRVTASSWQPAPHEILLTSVIALCAAGMWGLISYWRAWPTSNGHALLGGLTGAGWAAWGTEHIHNKTVLSIGAVLILSPLIGFFISYLLTHSLKWLGGWFSIRVKPVTDILHVFSCLFVSCAHGSNDGQLVMGVLLPVLVGGASFTTVPFSIRFMVASALGFGVLLGGQRILRKLGMKFYRIQNIQGVSAEFSAAGTVLACGLTGFPASTTQVIAGSIMGSAVAENVRRARWTIAQEMVLSWVVTFPAVGMMAYGVTWVVQWWEALL